LSEAGIALARTALAGNPIAFDLTWPAQIISFLILVWILAKFAWKPLMGMMEKRRLFIEENLTHAEQERKEAEKIRIEYQEEMRNARQEAQTIIEQATKASEQRAAEIVNDARKETEKLKTSALAEIEREREKAVAEVKGQVAELSIAVAERLLQSKLELSGQAELIDRFSQEVGDRPCSTELWRAAMRRLSLSWLWRLPPWKQLTTNCGRSRPCWTPSLICATCSIIPVWKRMKNARS
jgi:F-type H+-transporting ATPase subunit b